MAECNAQFLQISIGHIGQNLKIDGILGKDGRVLCEADPIEPVCYLVVDTHCACSRAFTPIKSHDISLALKSNALTRSKSLPAWLRQQKCAATLCTPLHRFYPSVPDPSVTAITPEPHKHWQCTIDS